MLQIIIISFPSVNMGYYSDYLYVYDGYSTLAPRIALVTGSQSPLNYRTSQRYMFVRFTSGTSSSYSGFNATYIAYIEPGTYMRMTYDYGVFTAFTLRCK
jgi:CUB domain